MKEFFCQIGLDSSFVMFFFANRKEVQKHKSRTRVINVWLQKKKYQYEIHRINAVLRDEKVGYSIFSQVIKQKWNYKKNGAYIYINIPHIPLERRL